MLMRAATVVHVLHGLFYVLLQLPVVAAIILSFKFYCKFYCSCDPSFRVRYTGCCGGWRGNDDVTVVVWRNGDVSPELVELGGASDNGWRWWEIGWFERRYFTHRLQVLPIMTAVLTVCTTQYTLSVTGASIHRRHPPPKKKKSGNIFRGNVK